MKNYILVILFFCTLAACNNESGSETTADSTNKFNPPAITDTGSSGKDSGVVATDDALIDTSHIILEALKARDFEELASHINPSVGLRFAPYHYTDTSENQVLTPYQLRMAAQKSSVLLWGSFDGTGDPIRMDIRKYFDRFVYNKDFLNAPEISTGIISSNGNSRDAIQELYIDSPYTSFRFPGFEKKYDGMDWQSITLIFQQQGERTYLVAVIHDEWTI